MKNLDSLLLANYVAIKIYFRYIQMMGVSFEFWYFSFTQTGVDWGSFASNIEYFSSV